MRTCLECGAEYDPRGTRRQYCSPLCRRVASKARERHNPGLKRCRSCLIDLPVDKFTRGHTRCLDCEALHGSGRKRCTECGDVKPFDQFHKRPNRQLGYDARCKRCRSEDSKRRNATPEGRARNQANKLRTRFSIGPDEYAAMHADQDGKCAICGSTPPDTLHVDHCHKGGQIRQLLCRQCNALLGNCQDKPEILRSAIAYLERHAWQTTASSATTSPMTTNPPEEP